MPQLSAILIDGGYLDALLCANFDGQPIDHQRLADALSPGIPILHTFYYAGEPWPGPLLDATDPKRFSGKQPFFHSLQQLPNFIVRLGQLAHRCPDLTARSVFEPKPVSIQLAIDLARLSIQHLVTRAILIAGNPGFTPSVQIAREEDLEVVLAHGADVDPDLLAAVTGTISIDQQFISAIRSDEP